MRLLIHGINVPLKYPSPPTPCALRRMPPPSPAPRRPLGGHPSPSLGAPAPPPSAAPNPRGDPWGGAGQPCIKNPSAYIHTDKTEPIGVETQSCLACRCRLGAFCLLRAAKSPTSSERHSSPRSKPWHCKGRHGLLRVLRGVRNPTFRKSKPWRGNAAKACFAEGKIATRDALTIKKKFINMSSTRYLTPYDRGPHALDALSICIYIYIYCIVL